MLSLRCSLSRCFFCSFSRVFQSGRKECSSACFDEDIRDMSFSPNTKQNTLTENNKSATENRFTSQKSLLFPFFFLFAFASLFPFSFVRFAKGVRCRDFNKRSRHEAREICSQTVFQIRNSYRTRDPFFRGTNRVASNASFANVWSTGSVLPIRVVPPSSFSSRVKSTWSLSSILNAENKSFSEKPLRKKNEHFYFISTL